MSLEQAARIAEEFAREKRSASDLRSYLITKGASEQVAQIAVKIFQGAIK